MFLLQQASLMQAAKLYTAEKGAIAPDQNAAVCSLAISQKAGDAKTICDTGLRFSKTFYDNVVEEWKQVGLPISDDTVVLSLGTDVTGVRNGTEAIGSAVWARHPRAFPVAWAGGTWQTTAAATTADGIAGFVPANSTRWKDLEAAYRTSHTSVVPAVQTPVQLFRNGTQPWSAAGVTPFAPLDILSTLRDSTPGGDARNFDTTGVSAVWMPGETTTRDIPAYRFAAHSEEGDYHTYGNTSGLAFAPTTVFEKRLNPSWVNETGLTVRCMVVPVDGALCDGERIASWFIAHQKTDWSGADKIFSVTPSSSAVGTFEARTRAPNYCSTYFDGDERLNDACDWGFSLGVNEVPSWLAPLTLRDGSSYEGPVANQTLWPVAPVPAECGTTLWGVPTRCGASMDAWIKANIPNPSVSGPVANALPRIDGVYTVSCEGYNWVDRADEAGVEVVTGDVNWSGTLPDGRSFTTTVAKSSRLDLTDFARKAGWYDSAPPLFSLRCSFDAHYADSATTSTVTSLAAGVKLSDGRYVLRDSALGEPSTDPAAVTDVAGGGGATLAATGSSAALWVAASALVLLAGAALALLSRRRRRAS
jgi:LPXTG-motif cell wall-anchored protein